MTEENYKIHIDGDWELDDLYVFPRTYEQIYYLVYALMPHTEDYRIDRINHAFSKYPWQGGYSALNFYNHLKGTFPKRERPHIKSLQYASPGWIELTLIVVVATKIETIVKKVCGAIDTANSTYTNIHKGMHERELLRIKTESEKLDLEKKNLEFIQEQAKSMANILGFDNLEQIHLITGSPLKTLKILLSLYRRVRKLAEYEKKGKAKFKK